MKTLSLFGCTGSFIAAVSIHLIITNKISLRDSRLTSYHLSQQLAKEIDSLEYFRLGLFLTGIVLLIITIKLMSQRKIIDNPELLDDDQSR